ncbi:hypothetical protein OQA88_2630 [Cercophora sp. LCS_1]
MASTPHPTFPTPLRPTSFLALGPLTTTFTPHPSCSLHCFVPLSIGRPNAPHKSVCIAHQFFDCSRSLPCLPSSTLPTQYSDVLGYYSPGLFCPSGYETRLTLAGTTHIATPTITPTPTADGYLEPSSTTANQAGQPPGASSLLQYLNVEETAAFCCPSGYALVLTITETWQPVIHPLPYCLSTVIGGIWRYQSCVDQQIIEGSVTVGEFATSLSTRIVPRWIATGMSSEASNVFTLETAMGPEVPVASLSDSVVVETQKTMVVKDAFTVAPPVWIVWRDVDRGSGSEENAGLGKGVAAAIVVGCLVGIGVVVGAVWLLMKTRVKKRLKMKAGEEEVNEKTKTAELMTAMFPELETDRVLEMGGVPAAELMVEYSHDGRVYELGDGDAMVMAPRRCERRHDCL